MRMLYVDTAQRSAPLFPQNSSRSSLISSQLILNMGEPQGCVLSPPPPPPPLGPYSPMTPSTAPTPSLSSPTTQPSWASSQTTTRWPTERRSLTSWCKENNLSLNAYKSKEMIVDYRKQQGGTHPPPIHIGDAEIERVSSLRFLGVHIAEDLSWTLFVSTSFY